MRGPRYTTDSNAAIRQNTACTRGGWRAKASPSPSSLPSPSNITWTSCGGFQCGTVQVPLDYAHPTDGDIGIALIKKPATNVGGCIGSLLTNAGGPGASGIEFLRNNASALTGLNARFDLIGFDPRGIGASAPVHCLDGPGEDVFNALDPVLDDATEKQAAIQADKDFAAGCQQRSAKLLPFVDTPNAARDMDEIRAALGDEKLTYLGFSYGTFLGQTYAHLFPTHVRALALDGVVDPNLTANDLLLAQVVGFEQNLEAFLADCTSRSPCSFPKSRRPSPKPNSLLQTTH